MELTKQFQGTVEKTVKPSPLNSRRSVRPADRNDRRHIDPEGVAHLYYWKGLTWVRATPSGSLSSRTYLSAGRTDLRLLSGDALDKSLMLGHLQASLHGPRSIAIFSVWNLQKTLLSFQPYAIIWWCFFWNLRDKSLYTSHRSMSAAFPTFGRLPVAFPPPLQGNCEEGAIGERSDGGA